MSPTGPGRPGSYSEDMDPARPLRDVFAGLVSDESARQAHAADPEGFLEAAGHAELPGHLVAEAIINYADTAPAEVAEHLAPFVMANGPVPVDEGALPGETDWMQGLDLLAGAPGELALDADVAVDPHDAAARPGHEAGADQYADDSADPRAGAFLDDPFGLDFGHGDTDSVHTGRLGEAGEAGEAPAGGQVVGAEFGAHPAIDLGPGELDDADEVGDSGEVDEVGEAAGGPAGSGWLGGADLLDGSETPDHPEPSAGPGHPAADHDLPDRDPADGLDDL